MNIPTIMLMNFQSQPNLHHGDKGQELESLHCYDEFSQFDRYSCTALSLKVRAPLSERWQGWRRYKVDGYLNSEILQYYRSIYAPRIF